jgi:hypothetical protein
MSHEKSIMKSNETDLVKDPDTPYILDEKVQDFLEITDYLSKVLSVSDLISELLELIDSEL